MTAAEFWKSTPYLTRLYCQVEAKRDLNRCRHDVLTGFFAERFAREKRLSGDVLQKQLKHFGGEPRRTRRQTPAEMLKVAESIVAAFGGRDLRNKSMDH